ncbi:hypothetical protein [Craterilacuibacter sp. RT1T]|uniref:hypothetical protein n=1 Tax=Craterilacuibacter sp. RT1T TaxID=2942211 RepID=UPI0020C0132B|nr:hypothetical protein [Craterilacuibacter sp. RT1T]MCL6262759.1 hypothetical protein [Craterilacuibacter sp. RT1T]
MRRLQKQNLKVKSKSKSPKSIVIEAPEVMDVTEGSHREKTMRFLFLIDDYLSKGSVVRICFKNTKTLHPCGTLVFVSNIDVWKAKYPSRLRLKALPSDPVVAQLFKHIGILEQLGLMIELDTSHSMVKDWHYHSGNSMDAAEYRDLAISARDYIDHPEKSLFPGCLNEAVSNTIDHAYETEPSSNELPPKAVRKWWMFSQVRDGLMSVVIYDQGVGIPRSLLSKPMVQDIFKHLNKKDARLIEAAVSSPRTSTQLPYRGKGLPEMFSFSQQLHQGGLSILSARGGFFYDSERERYKRKHYNIKLPGTLVAWGIPASQTTSH